MTDHTGLVALAQDPDVLFQRARIRVTRVVDGPMTNVLVIQGNVNIGDLRLRVQTDSGQADDATVLIRRRMSERLTRLVADDSSGYRGITAGTPHTWLAPRDFGSGAACRWRGDTYPVIRRCKGVGLRRETVDDAAFFMDAMDYDFHLFSCLDTGQDSVVYRCGPTGYKVALLSLVDGPPRRRHLPVTICPRPAPTLTRDQAVARLCQTEMPFVFFSDTEAAQPTGAVLYQRYDGQYGLLTQTCPGTHACPGPTSKPPTI
jgi:hypothetical protein